MNAAIFKSLGFWITAITTVIGLLMTSGVVLSGSTFDQVAGWVLAILGTLGGHHAAATPPSTDAPTT